VPRVDSKGEEEEAMVAVALVVMEEVEGELDDDAEGGRTGTLGMGCVGGGGGGINAADERRRTEREE
jgi:hypothetical protein